MEKTSNILKTAIKTNVEHALAEDIGTGDITASLIQDNKKGIAQIITREQGVLCGTAWADETFHSVSPEIKIQWYFLDGNTITPNSILAEISGPIKAILSAERTALNFLQMLSGTASTSRYFAEKVQDTAVKILDTRKTLPGLRVAQKYAVKCGGCENHRLGLFDAFLIKENHIAACGDIKTAVARARKLTQSIPIEVEVENLEQLLEALSTGCERIMLDNFNISTIREAVKLAKGYEAKLEVSGNISMANLEEVASTGVDYISIGALTKNCTALDLSLILI